MKKWIGLLVLMIGIGFANAGFASDAACRKEIETLKQRLEELESRVGKDEEPVKPGESLPVRGEEMEKVREDIKGAPAEPSAPKANAQKPAAPPPVEGKEEKAVQKALLEKLGAFSLDVGVVGYFQGTNDATINGVDYENPDGAGYAADFEITFAPLPSGELLMRIHAGEGKGGDADLEDALFANLNTIGDDNPEDGSFSLLEVFYTQSFWRERVLLFIGKTEPVVFVDDNAFANDEYTQFVGKPFVNNPVLDSEDEFGPLLAVRTVPDEQLAFTFVYQSSSWPLLEEEDQKSVYDRIFTSPFLAGQLTFATAPAGLEGRYRVYAWTQTYDHPTLEGEGAEKGWGVGLSFDQFVDEKIGLFARAAYSNDDVYEVPWFWSMGASFFGIFPGREFDNLGVGAAGLAANDHLENDGTEYHFEAYYRVVATKYLAFSPDVQYVMNPRGDSSNDGVFAYMLRGEISF